ncbi:hypothetical protein TCAL_10766 [Tigriopus californicus]|uniref:cyclin-dependent kinase n=1 Tax=Tigriopus californicus TaxID=6832 RepID=A0A553PP28_TIGCA|nr:hypothetical protein TCAL_10766 [Tigriopus californicus]
MDSDEDVNYEGHNIRPPQPAYRPPHVRTGGGGSGGGGHSRGGFAAPERERHRDRHAHLTHPAPRRERDRDHRAERPVSGSRRRERPLPAPISAPSSGQTDLRSRLLNRGSDRPARGEKRRKRRDGRGTGPNSPEATTAAATIEVSDEDRAETNSDTASEHSGATPERGSSDETESGQEASASVDEVSGEGSSSGEQEGEEEEDDEDEEEGSSDPEASEGDEDEEEEEEEEGQVNDDPAEEEPIRERSKHAKRKESKRRPRSPSQSRRVSVDPNATPQRSPTPLRPENEPLVRERIAHDSDSDEDSRLEAALRGELRDEDDPIEKNGTPGSQRSFGDDMSKERKEEEAANKAAEDERDKLPPYLPSIYGCRSVEEFQCLNRIEEGTYGVVYRAKDKKTKEIVALKRLKMEREKEGFPITSLREINTLLISQHPNVVTVREIVVGSNMDKIYIVMDFVEHDLKSLMETMRSKKQVFLPAEVKCLMTQLLSAIAYLHDNWILHRDLKTSNLLLSHNGIVKVGDFGLAREYGSPLKPYTSIVVTLWYRSPELLLGQKEYSTYVDVWSLGCIFGELLHMEPLFPGKSDQDQLNRIFKLLGTLFLTVTFYFRLIDGSNVCVCPFHRSAGTPSEKIWTGYNKLPAVQKVKFVDYPISHLRNKFPSSMLSDAGLALMKKLLTYDPKKRISCEEALMAEYFQESPRAIDPSMFPTWPAKSEGGSSDKTKKVASPKPPSGGGAYKKINEDEIESRSASLAVDTGFSLANRQPTTALPSWQLRF